MGEGAPAREGEERRRPARVVPPRGEGAGRAPVASAMGAGLLSLKDVKIEDDKTQGPFCIYSCPLKGYGPKWHNLTSSGSQISILRVRGPKWHLETSSRAAGVFNSLIYNMLIIMYKVANFKLQW